MKRTHRAAFVSMVVAGLGAWGQTAAAQYDDQPPPLKTRLLQLPIIDLKGTVEEVGTNLLSLKCEGQMFLLAVDPSHTRVQCNGTADRSYLKPGVLVRFEVALDKRMQPKGPIEELYVVTPSETAQPGIHADVAGDEDEDQPRGKARAATDTYVVVGPIKLIKDDQLQVVAGGKPIKIQLAKEVEIKVEVDDYTLAVAGDEIVVRGRTVQPPQGEQAGQVYGEDVTITLAKPLEATSASVAKKKPSRTARPVKRGGQ